jgi:DNA-binding LacI/PurR family transcriptional regulator
MTARPAGRAAPTLESVAARAGVSRATAGRVLAGSTTVGEQAREAVLRAAADLSYVTNRAARSLMTRRSDSIAFVVAEPEERFFGDPHFALVLRGAHAVLAAHDVQLMFSILSKPLDMTAAIDRRAGFDAELAARGLRSHGTLDSDWSVAGGRRAMLELLAAEPRLDGVFAANDLMAFGALQAVTETGRRVPGDIAIVGFDDSPTASSTHPAITTVRQPIIAMGEALATRLLAVIERGAPLEPMVMSTEIVLRKTA